jgi:hypothetical protein
MNEAVKEYIEKYSDEIRNLYMNLRDLIYESIPEESVENSLVEIEEKLWAKLPSYYVGENFVRLIPFRDHVNIEAAAVLQHTEELKAYKLTPKGMLQISLNQSLPAVLLKCIFNETLYK